MSIDELAERFAIDNHVTIVEGPGGLPVIDVRTDFARARIALQGAHVLDYRIDGSAPVLWMSAESAFADGEPIRGGIPVCWPWFGPHPQRDDLPAHGLARLRTWELVETDCCPDGQADIVLRLVSDDATRALWPHDFELEHRIRVGHHLDCRLLTRNTGSEPFTISTALHSYFAVSDVEEVRVRGLERRRYLDKLDGMAKRKQHGAVVVDGETDRVYIDTDDICYLDDPGLTRCVVIAKEGSRSTVVWNPWIEKSQRMPDFGDEEYHDMICVETCNAGPDEITVEAGGEHELRALINVERFGFSIDDLDS